MPREIEIGESTAQQKVPYRRKIVKRRVLRGLGRERGTSKTPSPLLLLLIGNTIIVDAASVITPTASCPQSSDISI